LHTEGTITADGKVITNLGDRTDPATGKVNRLRTVTTLIDKDHYTLEWDMVGDDGKGEKVEPIAKIGFLRPRA